MLPKYFRFLVECCAFVTSWFAVFGVEVTITVSSWSSHVACSLWMDLKGEWPVISTSAFEDWALGAPSEWVPTANCFVWGVVCIRVKIEGPGGHLSHGGGLTDFKNACYDVDCSRWRLGMDPRWQNCLSFGPHDKYLSCALVWSGFSHLQQWWNSVRWVIGFLSMKIGYF